MSSLYRSQDITWVEMNLRAKESGARLKILASTKFYPPESVYAFRAADCDGSDDYLVAADSTALRTGDINFTIAGWVRFDAVNSFQSVVGKGNFSVANTGEYLVQLNGTTSKLEFITENGTASQTLTFPETIVAGRWYFFLAYHDTTNDFKYLQVDTRSIEVSHSAGLAVQSVGMFVGRKPSETEAARHLNGRVCNIGFWKKVLTVSERSALYNAGTGLDYAGVVSEGLTTNLISYWEMDETTGTRADSHGADPMTPNNGVSYGNGPGNPAIYPLLTEQPIIGFSVGPIAAEQIDVTLSLYGDASIGNLYQSFASLLTGYDLHAQTVRIYYASKAKDAVVIGETAFPSLRATLEAQSYQLSDDSVSITIQCLDRWFKDKEIVKNINLDDHPNAWDQEYGKPMPYCWGTRLAGNDGFTARYGPIVSTRWIDIVTDNPYVADYSKAGSKLLYTATPNSFKTETTAVDQIDHYAFNKDDPGVGADPWQLLADFPSVASATPVEGLHNLTGSTWSNTLSLVTFPLAARAFTLSAAYISTGFRMILADLNNSVIDADGPIRVQLCHAEIRDTNNLYLLRVLREKLINGGDSRMGTGTGLGTEIVEVWDEPIVLLPNVQYAISVRWLRDDAAGGGDVLTLFYNPSTSDTDTFYVESFGNDDFLTKTASGTGLSIAVDSCYATDFNRGDSQGYTSVNLWARYRTGLTQRVPFEACTIKAYIKGIEDKSPAEHTTTANVIIQMPQEIISSVLNETSVAELEDTDTFAFNPASPDQTYAAIIQEQNYQNIVLEQSLTAQTLALLICEHARLRLFKRRDGLIDVWYTFNYDSYEVMSANYQEGPPVPISESDLEGEMYLVSVSETDPSQIVNDFTALYRRDYLEQERDIRTILQLGTNQYASKFFLNAEDSTDADTVREAALAESQAAFGKKEWKRELDFYDYKASVKYMVNYLADRYSQKQKRVTLQLLKRDWHELFLFDQIEVTHTKLVGSQVDGVSQPYVRDWDTIRLIDDEYEGATFTGSHKIDSYGDGIPIVTKAVGLLEGEIVDIQEQGPYMIVTVESLPYFYAEEI